MNLAQTLEGMLEWSAPEPTTTQHGAANLRTATPNGEFWGLWRANKSGLQSIGISPKLDGDAWVIRWYMREAALPAKVSHVNYPGTPSAPVSGPISAPVAHGVKWSAEQMAIFKWFAEGVGSLVVRARAGTGKTTTIKTAFSFAKESRMLYAVFNKKNQVEASGAIADPRVEIKTLHSVGYMFIQQVWPNAKPTDEVETDRVESIVGEQTPQNVKTQVKKLVGFAKNMLVNPTLEEMADLADEREIECPEFEDPANGGWDTIALSKAALSVLELSKKQDKAGRISFNDMVWLPVAMNWTRAWYDLVVVDEAQDMNLPQLLMAKAACKSNGRVCVVGDDCQAIYHFRGAASDGIDMMKRTLNAAELGLTITYRCPKQVVRIAAMMVPDYRAADSAPEGILETIPASTIEDRCQVGDAILSRANAPLMGVCLALLRKGIPARIEGKDIGKSLLEIAKKLNARTVPQFIEKLEKWGQKRLARYATAKNAEAKIQEISDKVETLMAVADGVSSIREIESRLQTLFGDTEKDGKPVVVCSTAHKAKGLEWKRVFLLSSTFNRKPKVNAPPVSTEAALASAKEEQNIYYVAVTRAKEHLVLTTGELKPRQ